MTSKLVLQKLQLTSLEVGLEPT